ncbi:AfsR/SARP family transcriptional regulator [Actinomadura rugatobispora]|uniref:BTAD domain-containing putative transcriptional regulator n=1 Tax=Actinomadura rugatobispora TaxID=1994 RepID=A0ABW0ZT00_9ACTN|nr:transcriptional regulator AfsR [Actinomadura rugatobispora]
MEFGILGPLLVRDGDGTAVPIASPRLRSLLAALLLRSGHTVTGEALANLIWDGAPPPSFRTTMHSYVARLRRTLGPELGARIVTASPGYRIELEPGELDLSRFVALHADGLSAARAGDWTRAATVLAAATDLWRGPALADVGATALRDEEHRLEEMRLQVHELKLEAAFHLGHHAEIIDEARRLVAEHPTRENLWARLILTLYRSGRRAAALATYRQVREILKEELGVEPGAELNELHQRILAGDPGLAPAGGARTVPFQLPPDSGDLVGRESTLSTLAEKLDPRREPGPRTAVVSGPGGIGKTTVAVRLAHHLSHRFPDGVLFADMHGSGSSPSDPAETLAMFLKALGITDLALQQSFEERVSLFRTMTADRRLLIVLDNVRDASQIRPLLPSGGRCRTIVTSRNTLADLVGAHFVELGALPDAAARALLGAIAGADRMRDGDGSLDRLVAACGGFPLAVRIVGSRLAVRPDWSLGHLADRLSDRTRRLDELEVGDLSVRASLGLSHAQLAPEEAAAFRLLAIPHMSTIDKEIAARALDIPILEADRLLEALLDVHLLESQGPGSYGYHDLVRAFAHGLTHELDSPAERLAAITETVRLMTDRLARLVPQPWPGAVVPEIVQNGQAASAAFESVRQNLLSCVEQVEGCHTLPCTLLTELVGLLFRPLFMGGYFDDLLMCGRMLLAKARREGDLGGEALGRLTVGWVNVHRGELDEADPLLREAMRMAHGLNDPYIIAAAQTALGLSYGQRGDSAAAIECLEEAAQVFSEHGLPGQQAMAYNYLGKHLLGAGRVSEAVQRLKQGQELAVKIGDVDVAAMALYTLGAALQSTDPGQAVHYGEQALAIMQNRGRHSEAIALTHLGQALLAAGRADEGRARLKRAAEIFTDMGDLRRATESQHIADTP